MKTSGTIYLAGGCFWGLQKYMSLINGVTKTTSGYANGNKENPTYQEVCKGDTDFRETVKVEYDGVSLETLLYAFFRVIDPTVENRQANDIGSQYQSGIYYIDEVSKSVIDKVVNIERKRTDEFKVEIKPLVNFYDAEEYHQDYLDKNVNGYCHIDLSMFNKAKSLSVDAGKYYYPNNIKEKIDELSYKVTQEAYTERPFNNKYFDHFEKGIYVDIVTGEPLFISSDKYESSCGWPAFSKPIDYNVIVESVDRSHSMIRTEVSSRVGNSHLGHVFENDFESPNGIRYCINSASLRFIPLKDMEIEGYKSFIHLLK